MNDHLDWVGASLFPKQAKDECKVPEQGTDTEEVTASEGQDLATEVGISPKIWAKLYAPERVKLMELFKSMPKKMMTKMVLTGKNPTSHQISKVMGFLSEFPTLIDYVQEVVGEK